MAPGLVLRVTLGEMDPEDAFSVRLPSSLKQLPVDALLERVFCEDEQGQSAVRSRLDLRRNPDLPEIYDALLEMFSDWRTGRCSLRFFETGHSEMRPTDKVLEHADRGESVPLAGRSDTIFSIVIEQRFTPLDYTVRLGHWQSEQALLDWLQENTLLYFIDAHDFRLALKPESEPDIGLLPIAERLREQGVLEPDPADEALAISETGMETLAGMIAETESYLSTYGVFCDVHHHAESGTVDFDTGTGVDLMVQVFQAEGIDPARAVFLLALYDSTLDTLDFDWREAIQDKEFFEELIAPVADHDLVEDGLVDEIIESGFAYAEEQEEDLAGLESRSEVLARPKRLKSSSSGEV
jgi:hypothetical protein